MNESTVETGASAVNLPLPPPPPPPTQRRPRVREVSSRFMSPLPPSSTTTLSSFSSSPLPTNKHRSSSVQKQRQTEPLSCTDENRDLIRSPPQRKRSVMKLFKENGGPSIRSHRPDTPTVTTSSKLRVIQQRSTPTISSATKLLQDSGMSATHLDNSNLNEVSLSASPLSSSSSCDALDNSKNEGNHLARSSSIQILPDIRSSMPEASSRLLIDRNISNRKNDSSKFSASPCSRSLDFPLSDTCEHSLIHSFKTVDKPAIKKIAGLPLPPAHVSRKGRKVPSHQEDVQSLRLLHNHYLQWRYANAKAEVCIKAQRRETERTLYSLGLKISELYDSVKQKRIEHSLLQRIKALSTILEAQMPYLEEWSTLEEDYSVSLTEAIQAFMNVSLRLPISGNFRSDVRELGEALNSATKLMESIVIHIQGLMPKAEEMEYFISELARVIGGERALIEECGDQLFMTFRSQVEECSIRGQLIQLQRLISHGQLQQDELIR
ncbi:protein ENDOSPERM DEFECTIVE 1 isoform X1 [Ricinus communis]|uniref:protein ENDOSPERM DEFECTIVE 1 isoform X1 n=1 Tax=Ricinus communis TaxID=3988 RepID=UPI0007729A34|nr:protein ENDOSPERM DEFECTIVE 1 isoform X1 [Ricinus communis]|eukprot:XP_015578480.1 protein ENDOSPERM DEFECTIVE 1 [Ricinus communis]